MNGLRLSYYGRVLEEVHEEGGSGGSGGLNVCMTSMRSVMTSEAWPSEETVREFFDSDAEKTGHERWEATNSNASHVPL